MELEAAKNFLATDYNLILEAHTCAVNHVKLTTDNKFIISSSEDNTIRIWSLLDKMQLATLRGHTD